MGPTTYALDAEGLRHFEASRASAVDAVTERFYSRHAVDYEPFGQRGRDACREDLNFHLEFLRPVLEFGIVQPMVDYLRWLNTVLEKRGVPAHHLSLSLDWLAEYFAGALAGHESQIVASALHRIKARFAEPDDAPPEIYRLMPERWPDCDAFEEALLQGDRHRATVMMDGLLGAGNGLVDVELHVIQPALYGIGRKWQNNSVTVAQEHLATAISQSVMTYGLVKSSMAAPLGRRIMLACVEGNNHAVGLQMVADAFQLAGWDAQYLGANVPTRALIGHVGESKPDLLGLSVSFAQQLRVVKDVVAGLTREYGAARPPVIIGGLAINQFSGLAGQLGADAWSPDARAALASASTLSLWPDRS